MAEVPSWFLIGEEDRIIPADLQHYMAERARAHRTIEIPAARTRSRSHPGAAAHQIIEAAAVYTPSCLRTTTTEGKAEMITSTTSTDPLVEVLATRLRLMDLVGWQRIAAWAEESGLSFEDLRLLLALALKMDDGPVVVSELADLAGFSLEWPTPPPTGSAVAATWVKKGVNIRSASRARARRHADAAHREGIRAYVEQLVLTNAGGSTPRSRSRDDPHDPTERTTHANHDQSPLSGKRDRSSRRTQAGGRRSYSSTGSGCCRAAGIAGPTCSRTRAMPR